MGLVQVTRRRPHCEKLERGRGLVRSACNVNHSARLTQCEKRFTGSAALMGYAIHHAERQTNMFGDFATAATSRLYEKLAYQRFDK